MIISRTPNSLRVRNSHPLRGGTGLSSSTVIPRRPFSHRQGGMIQLQCRICESIVDQRCRFGCTAVSFVSSGHPRESIITSASPSSSNDGVFSTTGKLIVSAFIGGALIKYGSLYSDLPFHPNPLAAVCIVCTPPVGFAIWMTAQGHSKNQSS